ncbi:MULTISPECIES: lipoprotein [Roseateles]|uniref:LPS translocon maturation chaperone LptM n=1 Tax=Roseateles TaxID=93681 RepID=UPI0009E66AE6|nr:MULTISPECIES: lipoprotein [Roseateles]
MKKTPVSVGAPTLAKIIALAITLTALAGCGQKGPLTLAKPADAASAPASAPTR